MPTITRDGIASARIADALRDAILRGEIGPGERIRQEKIAADQGASRLPVREAFRMLESEGLITLVANTGAWVSHLSLAECDELYQIRERIEPLLLSYSIPNLDDAAIAHLRAHDVDIMGEPVVSAGASAGQRWLYFRSPWGLQFELVSYPAGKAYEKDAVVKLWHPAHPAE